MRLLAANLLLCGALFAETGEVQTLSEALGHLIGKHLEEAGVPLDWDALAKGISDAQEGKNSPLDENACIEALAKYQEKKTTEVAKKNLAEAERFLAENRKKSAIHVLEEGKLQYEVRENGKGEAVAAYNAPLVRFSAHYLNGKPFGEAETEMLLQLQEAIPAFRLGLEGMKEGEKRTLFVHPDLGPGTEAQPNSLLIFDVEVIRSDAGGGEKPRPDPAEITAVQ